MERDIEDLGVIIEHVLGPVPVMHIPVKDEDTAQPMGLNSVLCSNSNIVHQAKATTRVNLVSITNLPGYVNKPLLS